MERVSTKHTPLEVAVAFFEDNEVHKFRLEFSSPRVGGATMTGNFGHVELWSSGPLGVIEDGTLIKVVELPREVKDYLRVLSYFEGTPKNIKKPRGKYNPFTELKSVEKRSFAVQVLRSEIECQGLQSGDYEKLMPKEYSVEK